ncbi:hypothetical protein H9X86_10980 [Pseudoflavonifractor capillosus]|uniref:hypothetical protein n=1 Tax=Pseudoflavonifractor capillosus TaxID=106588 RepID=UPI001959F2F7|nr:hypothetical protein [Pseudoflavonifractor capillosus]MBM6897867.1 hypothetical protein [Pseudoflavonifractor capillosus]
MERTKEEWQRYNINLSYKTLVGLLETNFPEGACVITLDYWRDYPAPGKLRARDQFVAWKRSARRRLGAVFPHIYAMGWNEKGDRYPIHRVITALPVASAAFVAGYWGYGDPKVETVPREGLEALARLMMREELEKGRVREFRKHTWDSNGLVRPGKAGKNGKAEKDHHSGEHCQDDSIHGPGTQGRGAGQG